MNADYYGYAFQLSHIGTPLEDSEILTSPGDSGGGHFDLNGNLVGVLEGKRPGYQGLEGVIDSIFIGVEDTKNMITQPNNREGRSLFIRQIVAKVR